MAAKVAGGPKSKYDLGQNSDINVTPFVDIMLVLLIVFMVAIPVATLAIKVDLPPATPPPPGAHPKPPTFVSLLDGGQIVVVNGETSQQTSTDLPHLATTLYANVGTEAAHKSILIRANRTVRYGEFMAVVNQLQADGLYNVALITEGPGAAA
jgi:biopolymer transport protein ExbD